MIGGSDVAPLPSVPVPSRRKGGPELGRLELTLQPEKLFYKDENGARAHLVVLFVVRGERTAELSAALQHATQYGRRRLCVPIDCELLYDGSLEAVEDQRILELVGSSRAEPDGCPEFDPTTMTGSVCYRLTKVSMRKDNAGFCLRISLRGLEGVIGPCTTDRTLVLSKRRLLRREDRLPEQSARELVETMARRRNSEAEEHLSRTAPGSKTVLELLKGDARFTRVPEYPLLLRSLPEGAEAQQRPKSSKSARPVHADSALGEDQPPPLPALSFASPGPAAADAAAAADDDAPLSARDGHELRQLVFQLFHKVNNLEAALLSMEQHGQPDGAPSAPGHTAGSATAGNHGLLPTLGNPHNQHNSLAGMCLSSLMRTSPGIAHLSSHGQTYTMSSLDLLAKISQGQVADEDGGAGGAGGGGGDISFSSGGGKRARGGKTEPSDPADVAQTSSIGLHGLATSDDGATFIPRILESVESHGAEGEQEQEEEHEQEEKHEQEEEQEVVVGGGVGITSSISTSSRSTSRGASKRARGSETDARDHARERTYSEASAGSDGSRERTRKARGRA
jgi:hypothetical protein